MQKPQPEIDTTALGGTNQDQPTDAQRGVESETQSATAVMIGTGTPPGEVSQAVKDELVAFDIVVLEEKVLECFRARSGVSTNIDTLLVMLDRHHGLRPERGKLQRRLRSLEQQELVERMVKPRSFYKLTATGMQVANLNGEKKPDAATGQ